MKQLQVLRIRFEAACHHDAAWKLAGVIKGMLRDPVWLARQTSCLVRCGRPPQLVHSVRLSPNDLGSLSFSSQQQAEAATQAELAANASAVPDVELYGDELVADEVVDPDLVIGEEGAEAGAESIAAKRTRAVQQRVDKNKMKKVLQSQIEVLPISPIKVRPRVGEEASGSGLWSFKSMYDMCIPFSLYRCKKRLCYAQSLQW